MHTYMYIQCIDDELCSSQANIAEENQHYCTISLRHVTESDTSNHLLLTSN